MSLIQTKLIQLCFNIIHDFQMKQHSVSGHTLVPMCHYSLVKYNIVLGHLSHTSHTHIALIFHPL